VIEVKVAKKVSTTEIKENIIAFFHKEKKNAAESGRVNRQNYISEKKEKLDSAKFTKKTEWVFK
jgi:hypothetical protein